MKTRKFLEQFGMATLFALVLIAAPVRAATLETEEIVYEVEEVAAGDQQEGTTERFVAQPFGDIAPSRTPIASFGPFHMVAPDRAELIGSVESGGLSPRVPAWRATRRRFRVERRRKRGYCAPKRSPRNFAARGGAPALNALGSDRMP